MAGIITIIFEVLAGPISKLFGLTTTGENKGQIITLCETSIRIASIGYVFMGISLAIQGILQAWDKPLKIEIVIGGNIGPFTKLMEMLENVRTTNNNLLFVVIMYMA